jgi:predicted NodU family carbamoyl transferase
MRRPTLPFCTAFTSSEAHREQTAELGTGLGMLETVRSGIPAVTHVDYSARLQGVDRTRNRAFRRLLERFWARTGCSVLVNTSFNVRAEPIVCTPDACGAYDRLTIKATRELRRAA